MPPKLLNTQETEYMPAAYLGWGHLYAVNVQYMEGVRCDIFIASLLSMQANSDRL